MYGDAHRMPTVAYAGIDLAFARDKLLPIAVCVRAGTRLQPLPLRRFRAVALPRGSTIWAVRPSAFPEETIACSS